MNTKYAPRNSRRANPAVAAVRRIGVALAVVLLIPVSIATSFARGPITTPAVGDAAPDFTLTALDGSKVTLSKMTAQGPVALIVLRGYPGYQCPFCTAQVGDLMGKSSQFSDAGARVILVYPGPADDLKAHADEFVNGKSIPKNFSFVLDPDYTFTNQYGLRWNAPHETAFPSTFVIDAKGKITFAKISHSHGGRTKSADVLTALAAPTNVTPVVAPPAVSPATKPAN